MSSLQLPSNDPSPSVHDLRRMFEGNREIAKSTPDLRVSELSKPLELSVWNANGNGKNTCAVTPSRRDFRQEKEKPQKMTPLETDGRFPRIQQSRGSQAPSVAKKPNTQRKVSNRQPETKTSKTNQRHACGSSVTHQKNTAYPRSKSVPRCRPIPPGNHLSARRQRGSSDELHKAPKPIAKLKPNIKKNDDLHSRRTSKCNGQQSREMEGDESQEEDNDDIDDNDDDESGHDDFYAQDFQDRVSSPRNRRKLPKATSKADNREQRDSHSQVTITKQIIKRGRRWCNSGVDDISSVSNINEDKDSRLEYTQVHTGHNPDGYLSESDDCSDSASIVDSYSSDEYEIDSRDKYSSSHELEHQEHSESQSDNVDSDYDDGVENADYDHDVTWDQNAENRTCYEHNLRRKISPEPNEAKRSQAIRSSDKQATLPSKPRGTIQEENCVVKDIERRQNDRKKKRVLNIKSANLTTSEQLSGRSKQDAKNPDSSKTSKLSFSIAADSNVSQRHQSITIPVICYPDETSSSSSKAKHFSLHDVAIPKPCNGRSASDGIGFKEFSRRQHILGERFGGVIARRRSMVDNGHEEMARIDTAFHEGRHRSEMNLSDLATCHKTMNIQTEHASYDVTTCPGLSHDDTRHRMSVGETPQHRRRHSAFEQEIQDRRNEVLCRQTDGDHIQFTDAYYGDREEQFSDDDFSDDNSVPDEDEPTIRPQTQTIEYVNNELILENPRQSIHVDSSYQDNIYDEPYSIVHIVGGEGVDSVATDKDQKGQKSFRKFLKDRKFGTFQRRKKRPNLPLETHVAGNWDEAYLDPRSIACSMESPEDVFNEIVDFVSNSLEHLNFLSRRYVTNAALDPQNGILQEGEYRRLFARIQGLIDYLSKLLKDLENCYRSDSLICQLLLDAVTYDDLNIFKDYQVNSRFQDFTLSYLRKRRLAFRQIVTSLETPDEGRSYDVVRQKLCTLDVLLKQPCYFIQKLNLHIKRLQNVIQETNDPEAYVVRLVHDLVQSMNAINNECEDRDMKLQEKEEKHVSKILLRMEFGSDEGVISTEEMQISNESFAESWDDVIVYSSKKADGKDWKKAGSHVKLVTFERLVMLINVKQHKADGQNDVYYKLIDCANKNFVEIEKPSSDTYPFKVPVKKGSALNVFLVVIHKDPSPTKRMYYVCWEPSRLRNSFEGWRKNLTVPSGDNGEQYASWSRPKYKIVKSFIASERGELKVTIEDEVEIIENTNTGWARAENLTDNKQGWIPKYCLGDAIPGMFTRGVNIKQQQRVFRNDGHSHHSVIVRKDRKGRKQERRK